MATVKTPRLNLAKQASGDNPGTWEVDMNQGYDDADARFFRSGADDPVTLAEEADYIGQRFQDTATDLWWTATAAGAPGTWIKDFDVIDPLVTHPAPPTTLAEDYPHGHLNAVLEYLSPTEVQLRPLGGNTIYVDISGGRETITGAFIFDITTDREGAQTEDASTPYYLYLDNDTTPATLLPVVSKTPPDDIGGTKPGYHPTLTDHRCVGTKWNDDGSDIVPFDVFNGDVIFRKRGVDHVNVLSAAQALAWASQVVNIPKTMTAVFITAITESTSQMIAVYGIDGLSFTFAGSALHPLDAGMDDALLIVEAEFGNAGFHSESGSTRIAIINKATPAYSFAVTKAGNFHNVTIDGYSDPWAPRGF